MVKVETLPVVFLRNLPAGQALLDDSPDFSWGEGTIIYSVEEILDELERHDDDDGEWSLLRAALAEIQIENNSLRATNHDCELIAIAI